MAVAFFDVDDTILKGSSGVMLAKLMFLGKGETTSPRYIWDMLKALIDSKTGAVDYDNLMEKGLSQFEGRSKAEIDEIAQNCFDQYMRHNIYRLAYKEIVWHKKRGNHVVLLTASLQPLIDVLGDYLGVNKSIATNFHYKDGLMVATADKPFCYEEGKLILAREYVQEYGFDLKDCYFYSDSSSDLPLMEKVGHPMPTNPDPNLRRVAFLRNWRVKKFHTLLPPDFRPEHWK